MQQIFTHELIDWSNRSRADGDAGVWNSTQHRYRSYPVVVHPGEYTYSYEGNQNNLAFNPSAWTHPHTTFFRLVAGSADTRITGISKTSVAPRGGGTVIYLHNAGTASIQFDYESSSSTAANRFYDNDGYNCILGVGETWWIIYDDTRDRWVIPDALVSSKTPSVSTLNADERRSVVCVTLPFGRAYPEPAAINSVYDRRHIANLYRNE